jgi:hypothetical protein
MTAIYVDVDDTLIRSFGSKRIPMGSTIALVRDLHANGAELYCWSSGGADYARASAEELGLTDCFRAFLPKPSVLLDDVELSQWRVLQKHPTQCCSRTATELLSEVKAR